MIDASYNWYSFFDDENNLPEWFVEDEQRTYVPNLPITKDEILQEKLAIQEFNARPSKKVAEAKARKRKRMVWVLEKIRKQANQIAN